MIFNSRILLFALLIGVALPGLARAQTRDPVKELTDARRIYVPLEDLDVIIERDKQGVILPRARFDALIKQARANAEKNAVPPGSTIVVTNADYAARIAGDQLLISVVAELTQFEDDWRETKFSLQRLSLEQAHLDGEPALLGRHEDGSVSLFTEKRGNHTLKLQLSTELTAMGSDQVAAFSLLRAPSGFLTLSLPAGKRLLIGNLQLPRPAPLEQVADYQVAVGGSGGLQMRITDRAVDNAADVLTFASTGYGLNVSPGEATWHALTTLQIFGKPVDRLTFSIVRQLEIADIEATGLEAWNLADDPNDPTRTIISLTFGQAFDGTRKISFKGVMPVETGKPWYVPPLRITNVTSHIGQVVVQHAAGVRLRVEATSGVRRATSEQKPTTDMPDDMSKFNATEFLRFDVWQPDFTLRLTTQPKQREVQAAVAAVLDVNATGLELQAALTVETHFASLFELDIHIPSEWQVLSVQKENLPLKWQIVSLDQPGVNQLRVMLDPPLSTETSGQIRLALRRDVEGWPVEAEPIIVNLPELFLPQSSLTEGAFVVRGDEDLDLAALDLTGLDPQPLKADYERLRFQSQDTRFAGKLKITRKPSRIAAQTVTVGRIDPQTFHTFLQAVIEVQGGGVRSIKIALPESTGTALRFDCPGPRIVEQKPATPVNGERVWTLQFDQRLRGQALIVCDIELPRSDAKEFIVPQWRFVDAERQSGYFAVEASGEQRLTIVANEADGTALPEIDPLDLPNVFYQPKERIVAVHRAATPGTVLTLTEQKFEKLPVSTAICPLLHLSTILGRTGELQHRATFYLNVVGVQGLHVTFPTGTTVWATLVDGHPVEVRRKDDVYLVPLASQNAPDAPLPPNENLSEGNRIVQLFYRSLVAPVSQFGTMIQEPPVLTVESGQRIALPVEVLEQKWELHYPEETRLVESRSPLEPEQPLDSTSILGGWNSRLRVPTATDFGLHLLLVVVAIGVFAFFAYGHRPKILMIAQMVLIVSIFTVLIALLYSSTRQERSNAATFGRAVAPSASVASAPMSKSVESLEFEVGKDQIDEFQKAVPEARNLKFHSEDNPPRKELPRPVDHMRIDVVQEPRWEDNVVQHKPDGELRERIQGIGEDIDIDRRVLRPGMDLNGGTNLIYQADQQGLLSLAIDFVPPAGSREKTFRYFGADTSPSGIPLEVDYVDRHSGSMLRIFVLVLLAMLGWFLRDARSATKAKFATVGVVLPLALLPLVPMIWQPVIDGTFFGTIAAIMMWLMRACVSCGRRLADETTFDKTPRDPIVAATVIVILLLSSSVFAGENDPVEKPKSASDVAPRPTLIVPYDAGIEPLASERVFLSHEQFLQLYHLANPDKVSKQPAPQAGGILDAFYAAKLVSKPLNLEESVVEVTARYAVRSFVEGQLIVDLPIGQVSVRAAKLDGQSAALMVNSGGFKVAIAKSGLHVIDLIFTVPARLSGTTGSFVLPLLPVPAGKLSFELPAKDLSVRVNGSSTIFRRVARGDLATLEIPVDKGGEVTIAWQPQQARGAAVAVVHVDSVEAITVMDAGAAVSHGFALRVRQGGIADTSFLLPDTLRLQAVNGPDVGGWELQGEGAARKLRIIFRRNVTDETKLTIETFLDAKIGTESTVVQVPQIAPQDVTNEIGQLAVFAGNQFWMRAEQVEALIQIDGDKFATRVPVSRPNVAPNLAYRYSKRPFMLSLRLTRQESQANVAAEQAAFITLRKQNLTTRLRYNLTGAPRSSLSVALPAKFVLLDVQAAELRDWYVTQQDDGSTLTIELNSPKLGLIEVVLSGFTPRDPANVSIKFPQPLDATRLETTSAIWLDEGFTGILETFDGWKPVDASQVSGELRAVRKEHPVQFAFSSINASPSAITMQLTQSNPKLSANGLSMVTVTDVAVIYTLALQWQIDAAKTDALTLTTPNWLAGKLDFQGDGLREATQVDAGNDRTRWTIHLRSPVSGTYFATATAMLPPASNEVLAPALVFESDQRPLDSQRQYVLLINSSVSQLTSVDPSLTESVQREDVPVIVKQKFVDQATELVRVKSSLAAPKWSLHKFAKQQTAPASVNVADLTTILSRDGTYRAQAVYTIKNRSRQFLALKMPEGTELLSVFVAGQPSRAVTALLPSLNGKSAQLIALPKTSAASLSFPVKIVWRGRLGRALPKSATLNREEIEVPAPQIISQLDDADYGIPVARTRWTVYLPNDLDAQAVRSVAKHNLSLSDDSDILYGNAALQEAGELFGYLEQLLESNRGTQSRGNTKQIDVVTDNLKQLGQVLDQFQGLGDSEFNKNKADVKKRLSKVEKLIQDENQKANVALSKSKPSLRFMNEPESAIVRGEEIAQEQRRALVEGNEAAGINIPASNDAEFNFSLESKGAEVMSKLGKSDKKSESKVVGKAANPSRAQLRSANDVNVDALNSVVTNNTITRMTNQAGQGGQFGQAGQQGNVFFQTPSPQTGYESDTVGSTFNLGFIGGYVPDVGFGANNWALGGFRQNPSDHRGNGVMSGMGGGGGFGGGQFGRVPLSHGSGSDFTSTAGPVGSEATKIGNNLSLGVQQNQTININGAQGFGFEPGGNKPGSSAPNQQFGIPILTPTDKPQADSANGAQERMPGAKVGGGNPIIAQQDISRAQRGVIGFGGNSSPVRKQAGGLSLGIELPPSGRKLVFTKAGGDPRLTLAVRSGQSLRQGINLVWSAVWLLIGVTILLSLRKPNGLQQLMNQLPVIASLLGILGICVLPSPFIIGGFVLFLIGALVFVLRKRDMETSGTPSPASR